MNEQLLHINHNFEMALDVPIFFEEGSYAIQVEEYEISINYKEGISIYNYSVYNDTLWVHRSIISDGPSFIFVR